MLWITHSINRCSTLQRAYRLKDKFIQFPGSLIVTPVADPYHIIDRRSIHDRKVRDIRGFMKRPYPSYPERIPINLLQRISESKHAVELRQLDLHNLLGIRVSPMMRVVKQCTKTQSFLQPQDVVHHPRCIPFMHQDYIHIVQLFQQRRKPLLRIGSDIEFRKGFFELHNR